MSYRIEKFNMSHFDNFDYRDEVAAEVELLKGYEEMQKYWTFVLPLFTLLYENKPVMIYGMQSSGTGTYVPMVYAAKSIDKHTFRVIRCLYKYVEDFVGTDIRRFEAYVSATDYKTQKLAKFFGFEPIGFRRQAGADGGDQVIYERLWRK